MSSTPNVHNYMAVISPELVPAARDTATPDTVDALDLDYRESLPCWDLYDALCGGTRAMREAGELYLPKEPKEESGQYEARLARSFLHDAFSNTVDRLVSKPFAKPVTLRGTVPDKLQLIESDTDLAGNNLTWFAREVFRAALKYKVTYVLVDMPQKRENPTAADDMNPAFRPRFVHVTPRQLIGKKYGPDGKLTMVRIHERVIEAGKYSQKEVDFIRVITDTGWELHKRVVGEDNKAKWVLNDSGNHTYGAVPLYEFKVAEKPPLDGLAHLNVAHWQSMSDQRNYLRFIRIGILFGKGITAEEQSKGIIIGPNRMYTAENKDADLKFVEHTGQAVGAGREDLKDLEGRMEIAGLQPMVRKDGSATATEKVLDEGKTSSNIQSWARSLEGFLQVLYTVAAKWMKVNLPKDFKVDVYDDFGLSARATEDLQLIIEAWEKKLLTTQTALEEIRRRGILPETLDVADEIKRLAAEPDRESAAPAKKPSSTPDNNRGNGESMA